MELRMPQAVSSSRNSRLQYKLATSVRMHDQARGGPSAKPAHAQRIYHQFLRHPQPDRSSQHPATERVQDHRQLQPAFIGRNVGNGTCTHGIRHDRGKVTFDQVSRHRHISRRVARGLELTFGPSGFSPVVHARSISPGVAVTAATL